MARRSSVRPRGSYKGTRTYLPGTNMLRTVFSTPTGSVAVTDFMPVGRQLCAGVNDYVHLNAPARIVRRVEGLHGVLELETVYRPSREFARKPVQLHVGDGALRAGPEMPDLFADGDIADLGI